MTGRTPYLCPQPRLVGEPIWGEHPSSSQGGASDWGYSWLQLQPSCGTSDKPSVFLERALSFLLAPWESLLLLLMVT